MASFEYHRSDPWFNKLFNDSMRRLSTVVIKVLVDVGGDTDTILQLSPPSTLAYQGHQLQSPSCYL
ncbi:unnamed protein product [Musa hybrid cultivar]